MSPVVLAFAGGGLALTAAWMLARPGKGEPPPPIALPEVMPPESSGITPSQNEIEALARCIASEAGSGPINEQRAVAWTVRNRFRGKSIYATQHPWRAQKGANPPFSSARDAKDGHRKLAAEILVAPQSEDPTGGATSFFEPKMQDVFARAGALARAGETGDRVIDGVKLTDITRFKNYWKNADGIRKSWAPGSAPYATAGRFEFWGSARLLAQRGNPAPRDIVGSLELLGAKC